MNPQTSTFPPASKARQPAFPAALSALGLALTLGLAACGGGEPGNPALATTTATATERPAAAGRIVAPLVQDDGSLSPGDPQAQPADPGAWTRDGRYATATQAGMMEDALGDDALIVDVRCCDAVAVEQAVGLAWAMQAARDLPRDVPVLVRGEDLRLAAAAANRLSEGGLTHVWLVTP